jgi:hypothetical protein
MFEPDVYEELRWTNPEAIVFHEFDRAYIGYTEQKGSSPVACYDWKKCVEILVEDRGMTYDEAVEWMGYNVTDAYIGESTPCFLYARNPDA